MHEKLLTIAPEDERARNLLVMVLHRAAQQAADSDALNRLRRAVELAPDAAFLRPGYLDALYRNGRSSELVTVYEGLPEGESLAAPLLSAVAGAYREAGYAIGTAYQLADDLLDETGSESAIGKTLGTDRSRNKFTLAQADELSHSQLAVVICELRIKEFGSRE